MRGQKPDVKELLNAAHTSVSFAKFALEQAYAMLDEPTVEVADDGEIRGPACGHPRIQNAAAMGGEGPRTYCPDCATYFGANGEPE